MRKMSEELLKLRQWLQAEDYPSILELAKNKKRVLSLLTALSYDKENKISDNAVRAMGMAAKIIVECDPEYIRNTLLRLFWLVNDESGGIGWRAPEMIGEILYNCPGFDQFFPMLISLLDLENEDAPSFRAGTLWAIGRVAQVAKDDMLSALPKIQTFILSEEESDTKEMAVWCAKQLTTGEKQ
jgi:hypothetical protein